MLVLVYLVQTGSAIKADLVLQIIVLPSENFQINFIKITIKLLCISVKHGITQLAYLDLVPAFYIVLGEGLSACFLSEKNKHREKAIMD